jgi:spore coat protein U-like protein
MNRLILLSVGAATTFGLSLPARAATTSTSFAVTATVLKTCAVTANDLAFGNYDTTSVAPLDGATTLSVLCSPGTSFQVGLNAGTSGVSVTARSMANGGSSLNYALYQNAGRTTNWGNTPGTDTPAAATAGVTATSLSVYGRVPAGQNVAQGSYTDTITVTVTY